MRVRVQRFAAVMGVALVGSIIGMLMHTRSGMMGAQVLWVLPLVIAMLTGMAKTTTV